MQRYSVKITFVPEVYPTVVFGCRTKIYQDQGPGKGFIELKEFPITGIFETVSIKRVTKAQREPVKPVVIVAVGEVKRRFPIQRNSIRRSSDTVLQPSHQIHTQQ